MPTEANRNRPPRKKPTREAIRRSVASSTAIETGQSIAELERQLRDKSGRFRDLELAKP